jgi:hypothetical protein
MRMQAATAFLLPFLLLTTGCGSHRPSSISADNHSRATIGTLTHSGGLTFRTLSRRDAILLVKTQWSGRASCGPVENDPTGRADYHCILKLDGATFACLVPHIYFPSHSARFPNAPNVPAVLCSPAGGGKPPVVPAPRKNV